MLKNLRYLVSVLAVVTLSGCAAQKNIPLPSDFWQNRNNKIIVAATKPPEPGLYMEGYQGLLDVALVNMANGKLNTFLEKTELTRYKNLPSQLSKEMENRHIHARPYSDYVDNYRTKYLKILSQSGNDKILVVKLEALGVKQSYYGFIPMGEPVTYCAMSGELINVQDKKILWRYRTQTGDKIPGKWDQPPAFPNVDTALKSTFKRAQRELLDNFLETYDVAKKSR